MTCLILLLQRGPFYDVQIEVVDHLASAIEELWETNPIWTLTMLCTWQVNN
jgi:hypothetical protein